MKNKQALVKVAEWLEDGALHVETTTGHVLNDFNMEHAVTSQRCGTACCIAGALVQFENLVPPIKTGNLEWRTVGELAADHLDIEEGDADSLFLPWENFEYDSYYEFSDPDRAAKVIRHYLETGIVDWDLFPPSEAYCGDCYDD